ncbi:hypothetical protein [Pseudomonas sp.]|jgi:hypothetical protein|uniref:hypothetical protein n=1 Tax=Pseudomonas sp. TaxID=306 RepID=UPI0037C5C503
MVRLLGWLKDVTPEAACSAVDCFDQAHSLGSITGLCTVAFWLFNSCAQRLWSELWIRWVQLRAAPVGWAIEGVGGFLISEIFIAETTG